jgi:hypothetical protein
MKRCITTHAEFELRAYHPDLTKAANSHVISINFGFASDGGNVRDDFAAFLATVQNARFLPYRFTEAAGVVTIAPADDVIAETKAWMPPTGLGNGLMAWMDERAPDGWKPTDLTKTDVEVDYRETAATHLVDSVRGFDAPLPELAGLTRLVSLRSDNAFDPQTLILVPWFDGTSPKAISVTTSEVGKTPDNKTLVEVELDKVDSGGLTDLVIRARSLAFPLADRTSLIDESTGYLKIRPGSLETAEGLKRLRDRGPSLLWSFPQVLTIEWDQEKKPSEPDLDDLNRAIWVGMSGLVTLLDPLLIALTMVGTPREGPFVSTLITVLDAFNQDEQAQEPFGDFPTDDLSKVIANMVFAVAGRGVPPATLAATLAKAFNLTLPKEDALNTEEAFLPVLLALYAGAPAGKFDRKKARARFGQAFDRQVMVELPGFAKVAQDENEIEASALRVLEKAGLNAEWLRQRLPKKDEPGALQRCQAALDAFKTTLGDGFSGLLAARQAGGALMQTAVVNEVNQLKPDGWNIGDLVGFLESSKWFGIRLALSDLPKALLHNGISLRTLFEHLPMIDPALIDTNRQKELASALDDRLKAIVAELFPGDVIRRFKPDQLPRDLPVRIIVDSDTDDGDAFVSRFNGIGLLVKRNAETWRYANLAEIRPRYPKGTPKLDKLSIHPLQPVALDGHRELFFEYSGLPLASHAFDETAPADSGGTEPDDRPSFYDFDVAYVDLARRLPVLAYGATYAIAAHVVSKAGVLPKGLQRGDDQPWLPKDDPVVPASPPDPDAIFEELPYRRTTAIGSVELIETPSQGTRPRIGAGVEGVQPLAGDYPRLALAAPDGATAFLDVLRNADGTGTISLPSSDNAVFELKIADLWCLGDPGELTIEVLNQPDVLLENSGKENRKATETLKDPPPFAGGSIMLRIECVNGERIFSIGIAATPSAVPVEKCRLTLDPNARDLAGLSPAWIRLSLKGKATSISFADPTASHLNSQTSSRPGSNSPLLLAPDGPEWLQELRKPVNGILRFPQVGFVDFDRWFSNLKCRAIAFPKADHESDADAAKRAADFESRAMTAYLGRTLDPGLAALTDAMPDLSVAKIMLELCVVDGLVEKPSALVKNPKLVTKNVVIPLPALGDRKELKEGFQTHRLLKSLASSWGANIKLVCDGAELKLAANQVATKSGDTEWTVTVTVPRGVVARLTARPMVREEFFVAGSLQVFDASLLQLAIMKSDGHYVFDGYSRTIEGMLGELSDLPDNGWIELAGKSVAVAPARRSRSYDLTTDYSRHLEEDAWHWRMLGSIDIKTQRWRFTGRPIYNWIDPKNGAKWKDPANRIADDTQGLDDFEAEAFFDRDIQDADTQTQQLDPAPTPTVLQHFPWELPSATVFRHRLTLRSRYAGALLPDKKSTQPGYEVRQRGAALREDWIRVAMLADRTRLQLTRPQLRALMPLTVSSTDDAVAVAPQVMAVISEPPFVFGGLAERISAEVRTGFGFGFGLENQDSDVVHIVDSRKEFGPDPRLTYAATPHQTALALTLENEGPIGLTFDTPNVPAPTFANSALLLRPRQVQFDDAKERLASAGRFEEHFLSVGLCRYLDHRWLVDDEAPLDPTNAAIAEPIWIDVDQGIKVSAGDQVVLKLVREADRWKILASPMVLDPKGPKKVYAGALTELAVVGRDFAEGLALLHLPLEEGRAAMTVFGLPGNAEATGEGASARSGHLPHVLASFEWKVPDGVAALTLSVASKIKRVSASPVTHMNWTRTGKSFDMLDALDKKGAELPRLRTAELEGVRTNAGKTVNIVRRGSSDPIHPVSRLERNPLALQRHLAVISTVQASGIGRPLEVYHQATRIIGNELKIDLTGMAQAALRVVTYDVPARPLGFDTPLTDMTSTKFDVYAVVGDKYGDEKDEQNKAQRPIGLGFTYRPLGPALTSLGFRLKIDNVEDPITFKIDIDKAKKEPPTEVVFSFVNAAINWICAFPDGSTLSNPKPIKTGFALDWEKISKMETIEITPLGFENSGVALTEYWGDISILTVPPDGDLRSFSWNWLFTGRNLTAADAVTAARLVNVPEAEARIIAISPPIQVNR